MHYYYLNDLNILDVICLPLVKVAILSHMLKSYVQNCTFLKLYKCYMQNILKVSNIKVLVGQNGLFQRVILLYVSYYWEYCYWCTDTKSAF